MGLLVPLTSRHATLPSRRRPTLPRKHHRTFTPHHPLPTQPPRPPQRSRNMGRRLLAMPCLRNPRHNRIPTVTRPSRPRIHRFRPNGPQEHSPGTKQSEGPGMPRLYIPALQRGARTPNKAQAYLGSPPHTAQPSRGCVPSPIRPALVPFAPAFSNTPYSISAASRSPSATLATAVALSLIAYGRINCPP